MQTAFARGASVPVRAPRARVQRVRTVTVRAEGDSIDKAIDAIVSVVQASGSVVKSTIPVVKVRIFALISAVEWWFSPPFGPLMTMYTLLIAEIPGFGRSSARMWA